MKIFANENIAGSIIRALRERGHDVLSVKESMRGASDKVILARAQDEGRLVVTHDKILASLPSAGVFLRSAESFCCEPPAPILNPRDGGLLS